MATARDTKKKVLLLLASVIFSLVLFSVMTEAFLDYKYERWKSEYTQNGNWYGGLTTLSENPILMWEYRAHAESNDNKMPKIRTNRYGFRDVDYALKPDPADLFRISFLGDSVTLGFMVESEDTFVNRFAAYAAEEHPGLGIQTMNHGIDGYNTSQLYELLRSKIVQFEPRNVVYVMCLNDFDFEDSSGDKIRYFKKPNSFILERFGTLYRRLFGIDYHLWHFKRNRQEVFNRIIDMKTLLQERNIDFQVAILPIFRFKNCKNGWTYYPLSPIHDAIGRFLANERIPYVDFLEAFENQEKPPTYFSYDIWHPNKEGHDFIARRLEQFVLRDVEIALH